jgi:hypothetical protein
LTWLLNGSVPLLRDSVVSYFVSFRRPPPSKSEFREALATPGRPGVRVIAKQFGVNPGTVQRISRPFEQDAVAL